MISETEKKRVSEEMEDNQCLFDEQVYNNTKLLPAAEAEKM